MSVKNDVFVNFLFHHLCQYGGWVCCSNERVHSTVSILYKLLVLVCSCSSWPVVHNADMLRQTKTVSAKMKTVTFKTKTLGIPLFISVFHQMGQLWSQSRVQINQSQSSSLISAYFFVYLWISEKVKWFFIHLNSISNWLTYVSCACKINRWVD